MKTKTAAKHTPGPCRCKVTNQWMELKKPYIVFCPLHAAAPEIYSEGNKLVEALIECSPKHTKECQRDKDEGCWCGASKVWELRDSLSAAIAKAEGDTK